MPGYSVFSPRGIALFAGGVSLGIAASRLMPPLVAQARPLATGRDWASLLSDDHRHFLHLLTSMEESGGKSVLYRTQLFLRLKRGLAAHAMAEEDIIYPLISEETDTPGTAEKLYADHGAIKTHLYALERTMNDEPAWIARATELRKIIAEHAREEEETEFPRLQAVMDHDMQSRVARHVRREKAMVL